MKYASCIQLFTGRLRISITRHNRSLIDYSKGESERKGIYWIYEFNLTATVILEEAFTLNTLHYPKSLLEEAFTLTLLTGLLLTIYIHNTSWVVGKCNTSGEIVHLCLRFLCQYLHYFTGKILSKSHRSICVISPFIIFLLFWVFNLKISIVIDIRP